MNEIDKIEFSQVKWLALLIGQGLSENTEFVKAPRGTTSWLVSELTHFGKEKILIAREIIPLYPFFGMLVGYSEKRNILVMADL